MRNRFACLVKSKQVKQEVSNTVLLRPMKSISTHLSLGVPMPAKKLQIPKLQQKKVF